MGHPHNEFLYWAIEGGLAPLMGLVLMVWLVLRLLHQVPLTRAMAWAGILMPVFVHSQTEFPVYHSLPHWFMVLTLLFVIDAEHGRRVLLPAPPSWSRWPVRAWGLGMVLFMATGLVASQQITAFARQSERSGDLQRVLNPLIWHDRAAFLPSSQPAGSGPAEGDNAALLDYVSWARRFFTAHPKGGHLLQRLSGTGAGQ
ncbi:Wzy polymerase domain-containing protein [Oceanimonas sp. NS1]|nr:Wzy polymerase domain-containing protein [Oceanimonas sp. NS1]